MKMGKTYCIILFNFPFMKGIFVMNTFFGKTPLGEDAYLYTICCGQLQANLTDFGATLVNLFVPDAAGNMADVVLGFDSPAAYAASDTYFGATVGRNANRIRNAAFIINNKTYRLYANEGENNLHSGPDGYERRLWKVIRQQEDRITFSLHSPHGDQGFPGNADITVTYILEADCLHIVYDAVSDRDTVFNLTNHSYFNLAGHDHPEKAMEQILSMPARFFTPADSQSIPTGQCQPVEGTPFDFRLPKPIGRDIGQDHPSLLLQAGYDHNFEVFCNPCAYLTDPGSGRCMSVSTDCPGIQFYAANYTDTVGKGGVPYPKRSGICLETQYFPDAVHHPEWKQPIVKAGEKYHSVTTYRFSW